MRRIFKRPYETIKIEENKSWVTAWLNRPNSKNALSEKMIRELYAVSDIISKNSSVRGFAIRGTGNCFCAGADLKEFNDTLSITKKDRDAIIEKSELTAKLLERIYTMPQLSLALVDGFAFAGGVGLISCVDFVIATRNSKFSISETKVGLTPAQITPYVVEKVGKHLAKKLMLTGLLFDGVQACQYGIVDELVNNETELTQCFEKFQKNYELNGPKASIITKEILVMINNIEPSKRAHFLACKFAECITTEEASEGLAAFSEKRKPIWTS